MSGRWERIYSDSCVTTLLPHSSLFSLAETYPPTCHAVSNNSSFTALEALVLCWRIISMISPNCCSIDIAMLLFFIRLIFIYVCKQLLKFCYC